MPFPRDKLNSYEEVKVDLNPHWWFLIEPLVTVAGVLVLTILLEIWFDVPFLRWVMMPLLVVAAGWMGWRLLTWKSTYFVVTTDRLIYQAGVVAKRGIQIPLERVNNVNFHQRLFERMLGTGDLLIESGGESGQQRFTDIKDPSDVQNIIHAEMEANENRKFGMRTPSPAMAQPQPSGAPLPPPAADVLGQLEKLEGLLQRGVINQAEFNEQKAKLLGH